MKTKWLLQTSGFSSNNVLEQFEVLKRLGFEVNDFGLIPFTNTIANLDSILEPDSRFIIKGGTKILTLLNSINHISEASNLLNKEQLALSDVYLVALKKGLDYNIDSFNQEVYKEFGLPLLNSSAEYFKYDEVENRIFNKDMFIKPSRDLKAFNGGIIEAGTSIKDFIFNNFPQEYYKDEVIVVNELKNIYFEYRFFIIDGKVITGSLYKRGQTIVYDSLIPDYIMDKAKEFATLYSPADIFVMDLADTHAGIKIVEYNCWNASGLYHCNVPLLFNEINEFKLYNQ